MPKAASLTAGNGDHLPPVISSMIRSGRSRPRSGRSVRTHSSWSPGGDLIIDAHLISTASLNLSAPGVIDIEDATSGSDLTLDAGGTHQRRINDRRRADHANAGGDIGLNLVIAGSTITCSRVRDRSSPTG